MLNNRLIEFRAWHTPTGRLFPVGGLTDSRVYYRDDTDPTLLLDLPREECVLMQRTEYSDRNGQPLFEGDILRLDMVLCKADRESALESQPDIDPEYSCYEYISRYRGALKLTGLGDTIDHTDNGTYWYGWLHEEQDFVDEANLWLHRTLAGNLYANPEIAAETGCFALHPDHVREPNEV